MVNLKSRILMNERIRAGYHRMLIDVSAMKEPAKPGQFMNIRVDEDSHRLLRKPFSIYDYDEGSKTAEIVYKVIGGGTGNLSGKVGGQSVEVLAPLGNGYEIPSKSRRVMLVGGGTGLVSLHFLARVLAERGQKGITVFTGYRDEENVILDVDFEELGLKVMVATEDGSRGHKGYVTELFREALGAASADLAIYACGPKAMLKEVVCIAGRQNPDCFVSLEEFIGCGVGACMSCVVKVKTGKEKSAYEYKRVCREGPVFRGMSVLWE